MQCDNLRCLFRRDDILQKSFAIFDEAKDGLISEQDLINVTNQKGLQSDTADIHRMILEHDSNGDGKIDFQEVSISRRLRRTAPALLTVLPCLYELQHCICSAVYQHLHERNEKNMTYWFSAHCQSLLIAYNPVLFQTCTVFARQVCLNTLLLEVVPNGMFQVWHVIMQFKAMIQGDAIRAVQHSVDHTHSLGLAKRQVQPITDKLL